MLYMRLRQDRDYSFRVRIAGMQLHLANQYILPEDKVCKQSLLSYHYNFLPHMVYKKSHLSFPGIVLQDMELVEIIHSGKRFLVDMLDNL